MSARVSELKEIMRDRLYCHYRVVRMMVWTLARINGLIMGHGYALAIPNSEEGPTMEVTRLAIDLAKNLFELCGAREGDAAPAVAPRASDRLHA
jgi:hypothetical protein